MRRILGLCLHVASYLTACSTSPPSTDEALASDASVTQATEPLTTGDRRLEIRFAAYIPCEAVAVPIGFFRDFPFLGGDGRGPNHALIPTRSRAAMTLTLDPDRGVITGTDHHEIVSRGYSPSAVRTTRGSPCATVVGPPSATVRAEPIAAQMASMRHERRTRGDARDADTVTLRIGNRNPITFGAPALELFVTVTVRYAERAGRLVPRDIGWAGAHEGFPAVELYVDGERLYHYDPRLVGASASELVGDPDHPFEGAMVVDELGACASIHSCLRAGGSFGVGDVYEGVAQRCLLDRGAPEAFETCVRGGGGFACFERFTGCDAPDGASLDQKACVVARGGSSCFAR